MAGLQRVLLVEDNLELREMYSNFLKDNGYSVETANDGEEALEKSKNFMPDIIFLDVMMPKMDGFETLSKLRHDGEFNATTSKIVLMTNLNVSTEMNDEAKDDVDGYAVKADITMTDLIDIIKSFES